MQARMLRPLLGGLLALLTMATSAVAQVVPYNHELRLKQETMHRLYVRARYCMYDASKAMLYQGVRQRPAILVFTVSTCAGGFRGYLVNQMGWSLKDAERLIDAMANLELDHASSTV